ncbi:uncharacterized protein H6S33_010645 [Morchella sextelata]|uniref:uncharacterized protein n=1 Tax=Morchella sextelata TaxID=1174677 RepID=UPI001D055C4F|nr:uncharacterized protein H6S33_010645 [Morchella sextelata]KAH0611380.1 hypothetical protein H6S33_010645 [Morchella sextelata]
MAGLLGVTVCSWMLCICGLLGSTWTYPSLYGPECTGDKLVQLHPLPAGCTISVNSGSGGQCGTVQRIVHDLTDMLVHIVWTLFRVAFYRCGIQYMNVHDSIDEFTFNYIGFSPVSMIIMRG